MLKVTLLEEGNVKETAMYDTVEDVKKGEDVKAFIDFIEEGNAEACDTAIDIEAIKSDLDWCETLEDLKKVFAEHFDYSWVTLTVENIVESLTVENLKFSYYEASDNTIELQFEVDGKKVLVKGIPAVGTDDENYFEDEENLEKAIAAAKEIEEIE